MRVDFNTLHFGIKKEIRNFSYPPDKRIEVKKIEINDLRFISRKEFIKDSLSYSLNSLYKAGKWLNSKLTYFRNGKEITTIRSKAK